MSLHQQLLVEVKEWEDCAAQGYQLGALPRMLRAVVELHAPRPCLGFPEDACMHLDPHNVCSTCGPVEPYVIGDPDSTARCTTARAIARELGIEVP